MEVVEPDEIQILSSAADCKLVPMTGTYFSPIVTVDSSPTVMPRESRYLGFSVGDT